MDVLRHEVVASRIKEARQNKGWTGTMLAQKLGVAQGIVSAYERGVKKPSFDTLVLLAKTLDVSADYLMGLSDSPDAHSTKVAVPANGSRKIDAGMSFKNIVPPQNMMMIPVISPEIRPSAGIGNDYSYSDLEWTVIDTIPLADGEIAAFYSADNLLSMYVDGDSMEPQIHDGDLVVFNLTHEWVSGNIMVVCLDGRLLVKGLIYDGEGKPPILRSTNKDYPDIHVNENSFFVVYGRVLRIVRMVKPKPVI